MSKLERELLEHIIDDILDRTLGLAMVRQQAVTLPAPIRVMPRQIDRA